MECLAKDGKDAVNTNGIERYCYEHYQIYDSMRKLFNEVTNTGASFSWKDYLTKLLDRNNKEPWKISLVDATTGRTLDNVATVAKAELSQIQT